MTGQRSGGTGEFARRLHTFRMQKHWSRQDLADQMDVTLATVGNWERGKGFPQMGSRAHLCAVLGVTAQDLHLPPFNEDD